MDNWKTVRLSTLCTRIGDGLHGTPNYIEEGEIFFINGNNLRSGKIIIDEDTKRVSEEELENNYVALNDNSLLLGINGTLGNMAFYNGQKVMLGKSSAYLNFKTDINKFYYYYFQLPGVQKYFYDVATGSTIKNLSLKSLQDFEVPLPTENEYKKIAAVLSALDDKIELNNQLNVQLEQMAKTIYDYWFVQFDFPDENGKPYKSSGGKMVFNEVLKREIPVGWEVKSFDGLIDFTRGVSYTSSTMNDSEGVPMINLKSFNLNGTYRIDGLKYFTGKLHANRIISKGDLLIAITDVTREAEIIGRAIISPNFNENAVCSCDVSRVDILDESFSKNYLRYLFNSTYYHNYIKHYASGTLVLHLDLKGILWYKDVIPPKDQQSRFEIFVNNIDEKIQSNLKQNQELAQLRDWLLPMLMNGQVKVGSGKYEREEGGLGMVAEGRVQYEKD